MLISVDHTVTKTEKLNVEIDPMRVLYNIYQSAQKSAPKDAEYIKDGYWYVHDFYDYHKGVDVEVKGRKAFSWEIELWEAYILLKVRYKEAENEN